MTYALAYRIKVFNNRNECLATVELDTETTEEHAELMKNHIVAGFAPYRCQVTARYWCNVKGDYVREQIIQHA